MKAKDSPLHQVREEFIQQIFNEICHVPKYSDFRQNTFYVLAKHWLHIKAEQEKLFDSDDWFNPECRDELLLKIRAFLNRHIK